MAISPAVLRILGDIGRRLGPGAAGRPLKLLTLGYPDMLIDAKTLSDVIGPDRAGQIPFRGDSAGILQWHGMVGKLPAIYETGAALAALGFDMVAIDLSPSRGVERTADLNEPLPGDLVGAFDAVYDGGTLEHCFNVGQAIANVARAVRPGGYVLHLNPLCAINHGFFNFSPTFYYDFYTQNGFKVHLTLVSYGPVLEAQLAEISPTRRVREVPPESTNIVIAERITDDPIRWPRQTKYLENAGLGVRG